MVDNGSLNLFLAFWRPVYCDGVRCVGCGVIGKEPSEFCGRQQRSQQPKHSINVVAVIMQRIQRIRWGFALFVPFCNVVSLLHTVQPQMNEWTNRKSVKTFSIVNQNNQQQQQKKSFLNEKKKRIARQFCAFPIYQQWPRLSYYFDYSWHPVCYCCCFSSSSSFSLVSFENPFNMA